MADKDEAKTQPAEHATGTEVSTRPEEYSTGPTATAADDPNATKTYHVKDGAEHHVVVKGEARVLKGGDKAELTNSQYEAFKDKFLTANEYKAQQAGKEELAKGASAAEATGAAEATQENKTPEETQAATNEPSGKPNPAGQPGKAPDKK